MKFIVALLVLSIIIIIHELGHLLLAKKNGVYVTEFSVGMGPRLWSHKAKSGTQYSVKLLPIGGSCMMLGEDETSSEEGSLNSKSVWARISIMIAGPVFNFIFAFILAMIIIGVVGYDPATVVKVEENSPASAAGLQEGDLITKINGTNITIGREAMLYFQFNDLGDKPITIRYKRGDEKFTTTLQPVERRSYMLGITYGAGETEAEISTVSDGGAFQQAGFKAGDIITAVNGTKIATGVELSQYITSNPLTGEPVSITYKRAEDERTVDVTPMYTTTWQTGFAYNYTGRVKTDALGVIKYGANEVKYWIVSTVKGLGQMITGRVKSNEISGPVGIIDMMGDIVESGKEDFLYAVLNMINFSILISANLGVMNLLPIPALDGGRILFLIIEAIRGKPMDPEKEGIVHLIGFVAVMILMVFLVFNDITNIIRR